MMTMETSALDKKTQTALVDIAPFLSVALLEQAPTETMGLVRKYPVAQLEIDDEPVYRILTYSTFEREEQAKQVLKLIRYAGSQAAIKQEVTNVIFKRWPRVKKYFQGLKTTPKTKKAPTFSLEKVTDLFFSKTMNEETLHEVDQLGICAINDWLCQHFNLPYEESFTTARYLMRTRHEESLWKIPFSKQGYNFFKFETDEACALAITKSAQQIRETYQRYLQDKQPKTASKIKLLDWVKEGIESDYLQADWRNVSQYEGVLLRQYGIFLDQTLKDNPYTQSDLDNVLVTLEEWYTMCQGMARDKHEKLVYDSFNEYLDYILIPAVLNQIQLKQTIALRETCRTQSQRLRQQHTTTDTPTNTLAMDYKHLKTEHQHLKQTHDTLTAQHEKLQREYQDLLEQKRKREAELMATAQKEQKKQQEKYRQTQQDMQTALTSVTEERDLYQAELEEMENVVALKTCGDYQTKRQQWIERLNQPSVLIVGCHDRTVRRLKQVLPYAKYYGLDQNVNDQYFTTVTHVFQCAHMVKHAMLYKVNKCCPQAMLHSILSTNVDLILQGMYTHIIKDDQLLHDTTKNATQG